MPPKVDISTLDREVKEIHEAYPTWTLDNAFVHWFLQAFLVADPELAARAVTGISHDKGCDAVFIDDKLEKVFLLQGKYHRGTKPPNEPRTEVLAFAALSRKLHGAEKEFRDYLVAIDPIVGQRATEARARLRKRGYELCLYYVTTGKCSAPLKSEAEAEVAQATGLAIVSILDRSDIFSLLIDYLGGAAPPVPFLDLPIDARGIVGSDGVIQRYDPLTKIESWVLTMSGQDIARLYDKAGDRLFARNIRGFLGDTAINEGMRGTLHTEPHDFWYFNNRITIVCDSARKTAERGTAILRVTNPQIINGQQTTRTLHRSPSKDASVMVRVISVARGQERSHEEFEALVSKIVAATNWQNAILPSDLRSNDTRQVSLQRDFAKLRYHYVRKRQPKKEAKRLLGNQHWFRIKKDELAQLVAACEFDPVTVRSGKEGLFKQPYYDRIFDGRSVREYLSIFWLGRVAKYQGAGIPDRAYAKWHVLHFLWKHIQPVLRSRGTADAFRFLCERNKRLAGLDVAADRLYRAHLDFFKARRGKGPGAVDISHFFYRAHHHEAFERFWRGSINRHRKSFSTALTRFRDDLAAATER